MKTYITVQGDMWDNIAYDQLGDTKYTDALINANLCYHDVYIFSAGVRLTIPDIEARVTNKDLPPWKQVTG